MVTDAAQPRRQGEGARKSLLFIDDDPIVVASLKLLFARDFDTHEAHNAEDGISLFKKIKPTLVLLDLRLPGRDGLDILRSIREEDMETPVVIMTGFATLETAEESIRLGASDYLHKPFDAIHLKNRVAELAESPGFKDPQREKNILVESVNRLNQLELSENASSVFLHDVGSPLTGLLTMTDMLRSALKSGSLPDPETLGQHLEVISDNARYMASLVEHWRAFSEPQTLSLGTVPLNNVLSLAIELVRVRAAEKNVSLQWEPAPGSPTLHINRYAFARVLANLLQNGIDAVEPVNGSVHLSAGSREGWIWVKVRDNGPGIAPNLLDQVFDARFTTKSKSMGLGLYISRKIIEANGGRLTVRNHPSGGAEFSVSVEATEHECPIGD